jgi:serine/threonine protein kinase
VTLEKHVLQLASAHADNFGEPPVACLYEFYQTSAELCLVMTYYPCGSLWDVIVDNAKRNGNQGSINDANEKNMQVPLAEVVHYAAQIVLGLGWLHGTAHVAHRDVKPQNILIGLDARAVLTDFGSAAILESDVRNTSLAFGERSESSDLQVWSTTEWDAPRLVVQDACLTLHGTADYIAPDVLRSWERVLIQGPQNESLPDSCRYDASIDWWSFGVVIYELAYGTAPFYAELIDETYQLIKNFQVSPTSHPPKDHVFDLCKLKLATFIVSSGKLCG